MSQARVRLRLAWDTFFRQAFLLFAAIDLLLRAAFVRPRFRTVQVGRHLAIIDPLFVARFAAEPLLRGTDRLEVTGFAVAGLCCRMGLRPRRERPRGCRAAEQRHERAAVHSITSSARASSRRYGKANRFRGLGVYHQLAIDRRLHQKGAAASPLKQLCRRFHVAC